MSLPDNWHRMSLALLYNLLIDARNRRAAPQTTYDAVVWSLIHNHQQTPQLRADNARRLAELSHPQLESLVAALKKHQCDPAMIRALEACL